MPFREETKVLFGISRGKRMEYNAILNHLFPATLELMG